MFSLGPFGPRGVYLRRCFPCHGGLDRGAEPGARSASRRRRSGAKVLRYGNPDRKQWEANLKALLLASAAGVALTASALAQSDNLNTLQRMQTTGTGSEAFEPVEQSGEYADQLRQNLENIDL